jgi:hypothetical protein
MSLCLTKNSSFDESKEFLIRSTTTHHVAQRDFLRIEQTDLTIHPVRDRVLSMSRVRTLI